MAASPLAAAVSCGPVLNRASATVNVYVRRSKRNVFMLQGIMDTAALSSPRLVRDEGFTVGRTSETNEVSEMKG